MMNSIRATNTNKRNTEKKESEKKKHTRNSRRQQYIERLYEIILKTEEKKPQKKMMNIIIQLKTERKSHHTVH